MPFNIGPLELVVMLVIALAVFGLVVAALRLGLKGPLRSRTAASTTASPADEIEKLEALRRRGVLTDGEFESQKRAVLDR